MAIYGCIDWYRCFGRLYQRCSLIYQSKHALQFYYDCQIKTKFVLKFVYSISFGWYTSGLKLNWMGKVSLKWCTVFSCAVKNAELVVMSSELVLWSKGQKSNLSNANSFWQRQWNFFGFILNRIWQSLLCASRARIFGIFLTTQIWLSRFGCYVISIHKHALRERKKKAWVG